MIHQIRRLPLSDKIVHDVQYDISLCTCLAQKELVRSGRWMFRFGTNIYGTLLGLPSVHQYRVPGDLLLRLPLQLPAVADPRGGGVLQQPGPAAHHSRQLAGGAGRAGGGLERGQGDDHQHGILQWLPPVSSSDHRVGGAGGAGS